MRFWWSDYGYTLPIYALTKCLFLRSTSSKQMTIFSTIVMLLFLIICSSTTNANQNSNTQQLYQIRQPHLESIGISHHQASLESPSSVNHHSSFSIPNTKKLSPNNPNNNSVRKSMQVTSAHMKEPIKYSDNKKHYNSVENVLYVYRNSNTTLYCDLLQNNFTRGYRNMIWLKNNKRMITSYAVLASSTSSILSSSISSICLLLIRDIHHFSDYDDNTNNNDNNKKCKYIISSDNTGLFLQINQLNIKDIGHYQCAHINEHTGKILLKGKRILLKFNDTSSVSSSQRRRTRNIVESSLLSAKLTSEWSAPSSATSSNNDNRQQQEQIQHGPVNLSSQPQARTAAREHVEENDEKRRGESRRINPPPDSDQDDDDDDTIEEPRALPQIDQHQPSPGEPGASSSEDPNKNTNNPHKQTAPPRNEITINQHEKLTLKCEVNINFTNNIWLKDGEVVDSIILTSSMASSTVVHSESGHRYTRDRAGNLYINNVRLEDNGQWQCEAEDAFGYVMTAKPIHLIVLEPPRKPYLLIDNRRLDPGNLFVPVKESTELDIQCIVEGGNPKPRLTWDLSIAPTPSTAMDGPDMSVQVLNLTVIEEVTNSGSDSSIERANNGPSSNVDHNNGVVISEAKLRVLRAHHNATISCMVHHLTLDIPLQASLLLDVQYTPSFAITREPGFGIPIFEGMPVSLKCDVDANPTSTPVWEKDDGPPPVVQSLEGYLNFTAIRLEHSGWYKCTARYLSQQFSSIGYFLNVRYEASFDVTQEPEFDVSELSSTGKQLEVALGGAVHLQCPAGSHGCWSRVNSENGRLNPLGASQDLRLDKILYHEAGEYRCVAPSKDYKDKMDSLRNALIVNLSVKGRPTVHPQLQNLTSPPGETQSIIIEFCANPIYKSALWITENKIFRPGFGDPLNNRIFAHEIINSSTPNCYQSKLTFMSIEYKDSGEYIFLVRSSNGLAEGTVYVSVSHDANDPSIFFDSNHGSTIHQISSSISYHIQIIIVYIFIIKYMELL